MKVEPTPSDRETMAGLVERERKGGIERKLADEERGGNKK
jgi:hypothetical protein